PIGDDQTRPRDSSHEMVELPLDRGKIVEDVCMIELEIIQYRGPGPVMHKFGALVEEGRVVLISLDNEVLTVREPGRDREVDRDAASQDPRVAPSSLQAPGHHARRRGLAVGSGDR